MSAITVTLTNSCSGGNHLRFGITGAVTLTAPMQRSDLTDPITERDLEGFLSVIVKMAKNGRTINQARTLLQAGVTVTV